MNFATFNKNKRIKKEELLKEYNLKQDKKAL
jgi:hypothetical protein